MDMMETANVSPHPDRKDAAVVAFQERYLAENFMNRAKEIPHIGKVELAWAAAPVSSTPSSFTAASFGNGNGNGSAMDTSMEEVIDAGRADVDYDVADDDDRWLME